MTHVGELAIVGVDLNRRAGPSRWVKSLWSSLRPSMNPLLMGVPLEVRVKAYTVFDGWMTIKCVVPLQKDESKRGEVTLSINIPLWPLNLVFMVLKTSKSLVIVNQVYDRGPVQPSPQCTSILFYF